MPISTFAGGDHKVIFWLIGSSGVELRVRDIVVYGSEGLHAGLDIKPGDVPNAINVRSKGRIPVAILSGPGFDAPGEVVVASLTFGPTGEEQSLSFCSGKEDVNSDGFDDLVCHFDTIATGFQSGDTMGVLRGQLVDGRALFGSDIVRIVGGHSATNAQETESETKLLELGPPSAENLMGLGEGEPTTSAH